MSYELIQTASVIFTYGRERLDVGKRKDARSGRSQSV
ncbi:hypothetical protein GGE45_001576 [Rhizobium aethiopicum]|uniref:Uncharacterized protein n=1 Tax=Rhizobium aethiopicum TaxID=1138170 RepID=A0A7W6Q873_9HYPH|nr:hypothetical protein [Rhizobium aethiopicum]MBB4579252.1 hypothetical protein [Rhizobium aethiopicum]